MKNLAFIFSLLCMSVQYGHAQKNMATGTENRTYQAMVFDPLLDLDVVIQPMPEQEVWTSTYMWYPGQLAAFFQQQCRELSKVRCVNVGYPGKFFAKKNQAYFKKEVNLETDVRLEWAGPEKIILYVNEEKQSTPDNEIILKPGKNRLMFEVSTRQSLPCILLKGTTELESPDKWQVSMDKKYWTLPESAPEYNKPGILPDNTPEITARIKPAQILPLRNSFPMGKAAVNIGKNGLALIDFFHLEIGTLAFQAKGKGNVIVRVGETPEEALNKNERLFEQRGIAPFELTGERTIIHVPERAFRYVSLECSEGAEISDVCFNASLWPVEYQMQFESDNEYVNNLFRMAGATLHTSMHRFYLDGVKRDFLPWSMDAIVSTLAGDYLFGDQQVSKNGISISLLPSHPQKSDLGITDYPLHALIGLKQNYLRYGDMETSLQYKDRIMELINFYDSVVDENGFLHGQVSPTGFIPGWATKNGPDGKGMASYAQIMLYYNYRIVADFCDLWQDRASAKKYRKKAENLKRNIVEKFWDKEKKAFINGTERKGEQDKRISLHAQYWAILADIFPKEDYDNLFEKVLPDIPYYYQDISYEKGYELMAYAKAGRIKEMWGLIDRVFGDWMRQGHTRFPENFSPEASYEKQLQFYSRPFGLSLCHGANGVPPVVGVLHGILGFMPSDERSNEYTIRPELLTLQWVNARIPVKEGTIVLRLKAEGESEISIPEGCIVNLVMPDGKSTRKLKKEGNYTFSLESGK